MRVLYFSNGNSPHDQRFLEALVKTDHEIHFLGLKRSAAIKIPTGVREITFPGPRKINLFTLPGYARHFRCITDRVKPDLVHAGPVDGPALVAALAMFRPLVSMSWGADILYWAARNPFTDLACRFAIRHSTVFTGDCQAVCDKAAAYGFPRERMHQFPWGVDLEHFTPSASPTMREKLGWQDNFVFLSNRAFEPIYGVDVTVRSFIEAAGENPKVRLLLFGKGSQETRIREMVASASVNEKVHFGGYADLGELPGIYRSADVFLSASHCDGSSVSLMEALACGLPAIVSAIPANLVWVQEGIHGWTFADNDVPRMTEKMVHASRFNALDDLVRNARLLAEQRANWKNNFPVLLKAYEHAIEFIDRKVK